MNLFSFVLSLPLLHAHTRTQAFFPSLSLFLPFLLNSHALTQALTNPGAQTLAHMDIQRGHCLPFCRVGNGAESQEANMELMTPKKSFKVKIFHKISKPPFFCQLTLISKRPSGFVGPKTLRNHDEIDLTIFTS